MERAIVTNSIAVITDPSPELEQRLRKQFSYTDKGVEYSLRKMKKNPWKANSKECEELEKKLNGCLLMKSPKGHLIFSSGLIYNIQLGIPIEDRREETGKRVSFPWKKRPFDPRDYQEEALQLIENNWRGVINMATGLGKTLIAVHAVRRIKKRTLIVCPNVSIAKQFHSDLVEAFGDHRVGFFGDGKKKIRDITVGIAMSVRNHVQKFIDHDLGLVIFDETHHTPASTFHEIAFKLGGVGKIFGLTATAFRQDGKDIMIEACCGKILIERDIVWGVKNGWLAEPVFIVRKLQTPIKNYKGDKLKNYKFHVLNNEDTTQRIIQDGQSCMDAGRSTLILVEEVEHGEVISRALGIPFATGLDKKSQSYVDQLNEGSIPGLVGTRGKIGEGTNTKNVDALLFAQFSVGRGSVLQAIGRGLRKQGSKTHCLILDYMILGSDMLKRHAKRRISYYEEITDRVKVLEAA